MNEVEAINKVAQNLHLPPELRIPTARLRRRISERSIFVSRHERVVEVVEKAAAGDDEIPGFPPIRDVVRTPESGFVVADDFVELVIQCDGI